MEICLYTYQYSSRNKVSVPFTMMITYAVKVTCVTSSYADALFKVLITTLRLYICNCGNRNTGGLFVIPGVETLPGSKATTSQTTGSETTCLSDVPPAGWSNACRGTVSGNTGKTGAGNAAVCEKVVQMKMTEKRHG